MNEVKTDPLCVAVDKFLSALAAESRSQELVWADGVHLALGRLADAIQQEVQSAEQETKTVGDINPDLQNAPAVERHTQTMRTQLIQLGEKVHQLRTEVRTAREGRTVKSAQLRLLGEELGAALKKVRHAKDEFLLKTFNSNPGAGD